MPDKVRVMVFIDGSNLYKCVLATFKRRDFDIGKVAAKLAGARELLRIYYYNAPLNAAEDPEGARTQQRFLSSLGWIPRLEVRMGKLVPREHTYTCRRCNETHTVRTQVQKGVDTRLAIDVVTLAVRNRYDVGVLVSGDADLVEAINFVKEHYEKTIENAFTLEGWSPDLRAAADVKIVLDEQFMSDCWLEKRG